MKESATSPKRVPVPLAGVDLTTLPLSAAEGFVLSRVDGRACLDDLQLLTGLPKAQLLPVLERLAGLGAILLPWRPRSQYVQGASAVLAGGGRAGPKDGRNNAQETLRTPYDDPASPPAIDTREFDEPSALSLVERRRIVYAYHMVQDLTLYEQLGVSQHDERRIIRDAYFGLSKIFHPDAYFGVELGAYRAKLEAVFKQLTEAYEILNRKAKRADYDAFLRASGRWRSEAPPPSAEGAAGLSSGPAAEEVAASLPPAPPPPRPRKPLAERRRSAAERVRRRFAGLREPGAAQGVSPQRGPTQLESPLSALQRSLQQSPLRAATYLADAVKAAQLAVQRGDVAGAQRVVDYVLAQDPRHEEGLLLRARLEAGRTSSRGGGAQPDKRKPSR